MSDPSPSLDLDYRAYRLAALLSEFLEVGSLESFAAYSTSSTSPDPEPIVTDGAILSDNLC